MSVLPVSPMEDGEVGRVPSAPGSHASHGAAEASPPSVSIPSAAEVLLYEFYDAAGHGVFATACDGRARRKLAWRLEELGLARWCGTNWGSSFFAITAAGKTRIDADVKALQARHASGIEAAAAVETAQTGSTEGESPVGASGDETSPTPSHPPQVEQDQ